ncbi:MAG: thiamine-phosphate pyrophosphorylase [Paracoccaceae bacterium]|jgi:thiamine-phosphate pyrophosphorylase
MRIDLSLCLVTDPGARLDPPALALAAARGGATMVQLRDKHASDQAVADIARAMKAVLAPLGVPLIINDRAAAARLAGADGVHVGQGDMPPAQVRTIMGPDAIIGLSIDHADQVAHVDWSVVDYIGVGPVRATPTKPDHAAPLGFGGLAAICAAARCPAIAIGGIGAGDARAVHLAGAAGMAVVSAICGADDPEHAARALADEWRAR